MTERKRPMRRSAATKLGRTSVREARVEYDAVDDLPHEGLTRLSSKNQITIPAGMVRLMGWRPGDEIAVNVEGERIEVRKQLRGKELLDSLAGSLSHIKEWQTKEDVDRWVRSLRDEWETDLDREWQKTSRK
jgi:AbrB family looped-hinge helix DNA binding protein